MFGSRDIHDVYDIDRTSLLGAGSFGQVMMGKHQTSGQHYAVKQILKPTSQGAVGAKVQKQEVLIMRELKHPNVVRLIEDYEDELNYYLVIEFCCGGRLTSFVAHLASFTEGDAAYLMVQLLSAVRHVHGKGIIHRDIKPDNMLLESRSSVRSNTLKLIDFGLSCKCPPGQVVRASVGTAEFVSPQAIDGRYDTQADMWGCGVSMFWLLCGYLPFSGESSSRVFDVVRRGNFSFGSAEWQNVTENAKDLIRLLLKMRPSERWTAEQALQHVWVQQEAPGASGTLSKALQNFRMCGLRKNMQNQPRATVFSNVRGVLNEVSQLANAWLSPLRCTRNYSAAHESNMEINYPAAHESNMEIRRSPSSKL
jgi:calcium-dependent protein kinase